MMGSVQYDVPPHELADSQSRQNASQSAHVVCSTGLQKEIKQTQTHIQND